MPETLQVQLDENLDRIYTIDVEISDAAPLPRDKRNYDPLRNLPQTGFSFTARELLHAIGCKCSPIPTSRTDRSIIYALVHMDAFDLSQPILTISEAFHSDFQSNRSEEFGVGMTCLFADKLLGIPWDQLEPIHGPGTRFDYRGASGNLDCIFESRGTTIKSSQESQISGGINKKNIIHERQNDFFDIELVISTFIGRTGTTPRIIIADPDWSKFKQVYSETNNRYYRLRHYCRILQYIGLPDIAYQLYLYSKQYLAGKKSISHAIAGEKNDRGLLECIEINDDKFVGRWFDYWLPNDSKKFRKLGDIEKNNIIHPKSGIRVFQGIRRDIFRNGLKPEPFNQPLLNKNEINKYKKFQNAGVSVFSDGSLMIFEQKEGK